MSFSVVSCAQLDWCQCAEGRMRTAMIVVIAPGLDGSASLGEAQEDMLVETLVAQATME